MIEVIGGWFFAVHKNEVGMGWTGLAKREPFVNGHPFWEPGEVWFEFGDTAAGALAAIKRSMLH